MIEDLEDLEDEGDVKDGESGERQQGFAGSLPGVARNDS